ncbi:MAG: glycosyltransferase family 4 protein [Magnetococcales bacterium]|nr:glycosyltransferase family 4 protein [Magnetococcales bacterium]
MLDNLNPPLSIAHTESSLGWGGQEIRTLTEAVGMIRRGHQVSLLCPPHAQIFAAAQARNIPVHALHIARKGLFGLMEVARWLKSNPVDVVITHSSTDSWLTALACRLFSLPPRIIRLRHISAPIPRNRASRWLYTRGCQHIVATGTALRLQMIHDNHFPAERITSIPTGIDLKRFVPGHQALVRQQLCLPNDRFVIGIVATLRSWKGHAYLLEAVASLRRKDVHLLIVGDGPQRANLEQQIRELQLESHVSLPGNQEDVVPWLQACDLFALPSYANEGVPQSLMQAMACGVPVISTPVGSIEEIIQHSVTGLMVPPRDPIALAGAINTLLDDADLRDTFRLNALRFAQQFFSLESMLDRMEIVIRRATASPR